MEEQGHRQQPLVALVALDGQAMSVEELEREALEDLQEVLHRHLSRLPASSEWRVAFVRMELAAARSLGRPPLRLAQPARQG